MKKLLPLLLCTMFIATAVAAEKPVMRIGLVSDTHVTNDIKSCRWLKKALLLFRKEKVDMVANLGDIADLFYPQGYRHYRKTFNSVFPDPATRPEEIYVYANHDRLGADARKRPHMDVFKEVKQLLEIKHEPDDTMVFKGYPMLIVNQFIPLKKYEEMLTKLAAEHPGKPLFIFDHLPGNAYYRRRDMLRKFPQVIHLSGHSHGTLFDENRIWQDGYTALNLSCLARDWVGSLNGTCPKAKYAYDVCVMEVYENKIIFRRHSLQENKEYRPENPWTIPLPYDDATAPFTFERRAAAETAPEFAAGAAIAIEPDAVPFFNVKVTIPPARGGKIFDIDVEETDADGNWKRVASRQELNNFYLPENKRHTMIETILPGVLFQSGKKYRITATPIGFFGKKGKSISAEWTAPERVKTVVLFESENPMDDPRLRYMSDLNGGKVQPKKDGFYKHDTFNARLEVPKEIWDVPARSRIWVTADLHTIQPMNSRWTILWRNPAPSKNAHRRIRTYPGDNINRYVMSFRLRKNHKPYLLVREGYDGLIKFNYLKIERVLKK